ncbi:GIY-YIG nuclease family protein [Photobacterium kagoshimensis]|uniref:GIY-YIG nuclease family protein n=1 Tax=Photobacterium kagoshimensis TaxID=2910242 RepID=UPI003D124901
MLITCILVGLVTVSIGLLLRVRSNISGLQSKEAEIERIYAPATNKENELLVVETEYKELQELYKTELAQLKDQELRLSQYYLGVGTCDSVSYSQLTSTRNLDDICAQLEATKLKIKSFVKDKKACICLMDSDITVNGKKSEAKKLLNREVKLRIRCLDNEFKAASAIVDWNNVNRLIDRAQRAFDEINASGNLVKTKLQNEYLQLKIKELRLGYEHEQLKQDLKEEEREEKQIEREAEREEKRIKAAAEKAEKDREVMERLVAEELSKLESSSEEQKALFELHKQELEKLRDKEKRAISLAQQTRAGYVYVITNKMSFGEGMIKIGMTRRADPNDRVKELGDASVPELFDVHAFAFTEDAPKFEKFLHRKFSDQRVNLVNGRKEFFHISAEDALKAMDEYDGQFELSEIA